MQLRYNYRLYPTDSQQAALARFFGCARVVYNDGLKARRDAYEKGLPFPSTGDLSRKLITEAKKTPEREWLAEVSAGVLQQSLRDLDTAYKNLFDSIKGIRPRMEAPRFKTRRDRRQAIRFTSNTKWKITSSGHLRLPKIGDVKVKWSRALPSKSVTVTVVKDASGRYFASFVIETDPAVDLARMPEVEHAIGIDLGLTHFAVLSDGTKIASPRFMRRAEKKLKRAHQNLSRKKVGSKNRDKARVKLARAHAHVAAVRRNFHHQLSTKLIRENQAIAVESLAVSGLARTHLAKSIYDAGWSSFVTMLEYKAARYGRTLVRIGRYEPTSQVCSTCGVRGSHKPLRVRIWTCEACGVTLDRDINAAVNVAKAAGLAVTACGAQVRPGLVPAQRRETGSPQSVGKSMGEFAC